MQAVGKKNRTSLHSLYDFVLMTRGILCIGTGGPTYKRTRGLLCFGISSVGEYLSGDGLGRLLVDPGAAFRKLCFGNLHTVCVLSFSSCILVELFLLSYLLTSHLCLILGIRLLPYPFRGIVRFFLAEALVLNYESVILAWNSGTALSFKIASNLIK